MLIIRKCDCCGRINPKRLYGNDRLCGECAKPGGFYHQKGWALGASGKVGYYKIQFPFRIEFVGLFKLTRGKR